MSTAFNCIATGIGSIPLADPDKAVALALRYLPEAPIWPQLPQRSFLEHFCGQFSERFPGFVADTAKQSFFFDTSRDRSNDLERFYERYLARDLEYFMISEAYAAGFHAFVAHLQENGPSPRARLLKGHCTGPLTFGITIKDHLGKDIVYNELLFDAVTKGLAMKAAWQVKVLKQFGLPVIIFIDDPAMYALSSGLYSLSPDLAADKLREILAMVRNEGGITGIHCCGNADWSLLFRMGSDIVSFDAAGYLDKVLLYPAEIKEFLDRGGALSWGIVPTVDFTGRESVEGLITKLEGGISRLEASGISRETIIRQSILTPSCGVGSLTNENAEAILTLTKEVSAVMQQKIYHQPFFTTEPRRHGEGQIL